MNSEKFFTLLLSFLFLLPWSSGPIFVKMGLGYTGPMTFLELRFVFACLIFLLLSFVTRAPWPRTWKEVFHAAVAGIFIQAIYLMACFKVMAQGMTPGIFATILGAQPILTAVICRSYFKETVSSYQWLGLFIGFLGLFLVTANTLSNGDLNGKELFLLVIALFGITIGTLYQKKACHHIDPRTGCVIQYAVSSVFVFFFAYSFEPYHIEWTWPFILCLGWMVLAVSVGAMIVLQLLIKRREATSVTSLFYVVPPLTATMDYFVYGNTLTPTIILGMLIILVGVFLVNRQPGSRFSSLLPSRNRLPIK